MSFKVLKNTLTKAEVITIKRLCNHKTKKTQYNTVSNTITTFDVIENETILPIGIWREFYEKFPNEYPKKDAIHLNFKGKLINTKQRDQATVAKEAIDKLNTNRSVLLGCFTGMGKTCMGIYLTCYFKLKTVIICSISKLWTQWVDEFKKFSNAKVSIITGKKFDPTADVYIVGALKLSKMDSTLFDNIGLLIVDECHTICAQESCKSLQKIFPQYLIGLSATPDKSNGLDSILHVYFSNKKNIIYRHEVKPFVVIKYLTPFIPDINYTVINGKTVLDWTYIQNSLAYNVKRQKLIAELIIKYMDTGVLVLTKRKDEAIGISKILESKKIKHDVLIGKNNEWNKSTKVLIGGMKKIGIGFDSKMNTLILASDVLDIRQYEGRIRAHNNTIIDIVDNFRVLENHWENRRKWYIKRGATFDIDETMRETTREINKSHSRVNSGYDEPTPSIDILSSFKK